MLVDLPSEILIPIAEALGDFDEKAQGFKPDLLNFLCTNRRIYATCRKALYRSLIYANRKNGDDRRLFDMITGVYHSGFSRHIRHIRLRHWYTSTRPDIWDRIASITCHEISGPVSAFEHLWREATTLQSLDLDYPEHAHFLNEYSNTIQELTVRSVPNEQLTIEFLPFVLKWPCLRILCVRAGAIAKIPSLYTLVHAISSSTSSTSHLIVESSELPECVMIALLESPRALKSFTYGTIYYARNFKIAADKVPEESLPRTSRIAAALNKHNETLESLDIERTGKYWNAQMDEFGTLQHFRALKSLQIDATMLHGWDHCEHWRRCRPGLPDTHPDLPEEFATQLPTSLETLTVVIDRMFFKEKLKRYLVSLLKGILSGIQSKCLSNLRQIYSPVVVISSKTKSKIPAGTGSNGVLNSIGGKIRGSNNGGSSNGSPINGGISNDSGSGDNRNLNNSVSSGNNGLNNMGYDGNSGSNIGTSSNGGSNNGGLGNGNSNDSGSNNEASNADGSNNDTPWAAWPAIGPASVATPAKPDTTQSPMSLVTGTPALTSSPSDGSSGNGFPVSPIHSGSNGNGNDLLSSWSAWTGGSPAGFSPVKPYTGSADDEEVPFGSRAVVICVAFSLCK